MAVVKRVRTQANSSLIALCGLFVILCELSSDVSAFPSLFKRASIFGRYQQQSPLNSQLQQQNQLVSNSNTIKPMMSTGQLTSQLLQPGELLRISTMHQAQNQPQQQQIGAHQMQQQPYLSAAATSFGAPHALGAAGPHNQLAHSAQSVIYDDQAAPLMSQFLDSSAQAAAYYKSSMVRPMSNLKYNPAPNQAQQPPMQQPMQQQFEPAQLVQEQSFDMSDHSNNYLGAEMGPMAQAAPEARQQGQPHSEPTHTSEIVDKIEQHIEQQIEQGMRKGEKESAASGEPEESSEAEEGGEEHVEKREEEEHKDKKKKEEPEHEHHHHEHHHEHHLQVPPDAFEVHHKKGGKSYQYFHQGHSHP